ncbi:MAG TPA: DUF3048 domain-containing protein [Anaerolineaceae bacterium]|nr:DUF3048 domain-containing protein [Anaerolineaceae bacterium]
MKRSLLLVLMIFVLAACAPAATATPLPPTATATNTAVPPTATSTPLPPTATATSAPTATPTPLYPPEGLGPTGFPVNVDPLTGLKVEDKNILNRRPVVVKVENLPRVSRPQWGLSFADIVFEYYTEYGTTRFAAVYYGQNSEQIGPIRSGRWFDFNVVRMFKSVFVFGSAYAELYSAFLQSDFGNRIVLERGASSCPTICRVDPNGYNHEVLNLTGFNEYLATWGVDNTVQNQDGMFFNLKTPAGGVPVNQMFIRFSGSVYNRYDYDTATGRYMRFVDTKEDMDRASAEYTAMLDRVTGEQIGIENVVVIVVSYDLVPSSDNREIFSMTLLGEGPAYIMRDGQGYEVRWKRAKDSNVLTLIDADGNPFAYKPGTTWYEVVGVYSFFTKEANIWHFEHRIP